MRLVFAGALHAAGEGRLVQPQRDQAVLAGDETVEARLQPIDTIDQQQRLKRMARARQGTVRSVRSGSFSGLTPCVHHSRYDSSARLSGWVV